MNWRRWLGPALAIAIVAVLAFIVEREFSRLSVRAVLEAARTTPAGDTWLAVAFTALTFAVLPFYDGLALRFVGHPQSAARTAYGALIEYGISQTVGFQAVTGSALRARLWSSWGVDAPSIARAAAFSSLSFTIGLVVIAGAALLLEPGIVLGALHLPSAVARGLGGAAVLGGAAYLAWLAITPRRELTLGRFTMPVPPLRVAAAQLAVSLVDWGAAAAVLYVLLPAELPVSFPAFLGAFVLAQGAGLASHVPGGIGVFDVAMLLLLAPGGDAARVTGALVVYRGVYYLLPLCLAVLALALHEARRATQGPLAPALALATRWSAALLPTALALLLFATGTVLLVTGALPIPQHHALLPVAVVPLPLREGGHFVASLLGATLLVLAWGTHERLDAAYRATQLALAAGLVAALFRGAPVVVIVLVAVALVATRLGRGVFVRRSALTAEVLSAGWTTAIVAVLAGSTWIGFFAYRHVAYRAELWWRFAESADAPRFLRALAGIAAVAVVYGLLRLLRHARPDVRVDVGADAAVEAIVAAAPTTTAKLALLGDKRFLFSDERDAFVMYGVRGRTWVSMGDPVGPAAAARELTWRFKELAAQHGGWPVFYEVRAEQLPLYVELGLSLMKIGEEARVPLAGFSLDGSARKNLRRSLRVAEAAGATVRIVEPAELTPLLPALRRISDEWLAARRAREKGFSLGRFDERFLVHFRCAVVFVGDAPVAFANLWEAAGKTELAPDLMRYGAAAPGNVMEFLFTWLMQWAAREGYGYFNLGMAPLAGLASRASAPFAARAGDFLFQHGESFYGFQGLRAFKAKFHPEWSPRYLAAPGGLVFPRALAGVTFLIGGGVGATLRR